MQKSRVTPRRCTAGRACRFVAAACGSDDDDASEQHAHRPAPSTAAPRRQRAPRRRRHRGTSGTEAAGTEAPPAPTRGSRRRSRVRQRDERRRRRRSRGLAGHDAVRRAHRRSSWPACARSTRASTDFNYAAETYDAVMIIGARGRAGAATTASRTASEINGITRDGEKCTDVRRLRRAHRSRHRHRLRRRVRSARVRRQRRADRGQLRPAEVRRQQPHRRSRRPTYIDGRRRRRARRRRHVPVEGTRAGDGVLTIGTLLPADGLAGVPRTAGVRRRSTWPSRRSTRPVACSASTSSGIEGDSGDTTTDSANQTTSTVCSSENVDAIIGAASSGVSLTVIDKITGAGVVQFSPANTVETLSTYADKGLYFRTAPPDIFQGDVLGQLIAEDGNQTVAILNLNDAYGNGLAETAAKTVTDVRWRGRRTRRSYDPAAHVVRHRGRRDRRGRPRRDRGHRLRRVVADPAHDGREGHRPDGQGRLRQRRQHRQRPRRELRRRQLIQRDCTSPELLKRGPGTSARAPPTGARGRGPGSVVVAMAADGSSVPAWTTRPGQRGRRREPATAGR